MSHDTLVHRLVRPLVRPLARTPVRPDHLTLARALTGLLAAALFARGGRRPVRAGACAFAASFLLDRADGELARLTGRYSRGGHRWDLVADCGTDMLCFAGLGLGARSGPLGRWSLPLGLLASASVAALFRALHAAPARAPSPPRPLDPDDALLAVPVLLWALGPPPVLLLAGTLTPLGALGTLLRQGSKQAPSSSEQKEAGRLPPI